MILQVTADLLAQRPGAFAVDDSRLFQSGQVQVVQVPVWNGGRLVEGRLAPA